jgi:hypothetical protein
MTRRHRDDYEALVQAVERYAAYFGRGPEVYRFARRPVDLTREILAAIERGEPLTAAETSRRLGIDPPSDDVEL